MVWQRLIDEGPGLRDQRIVRTFTPVGWQILIEEEGITFDPVLDEPLNAR